MFQNNPFPQQQQLQQQQQLPSTTYISTTTPLSGQLGGNFAGDSQLLNQQPQFINNPALRSTTSLHTFPGTVGSERNNGLYNQGGLQQPLGLQQGGLQQGDLQQQQPLGGGLFHYQNNTFQQQKHAIVNPRLRSATGLHTAPGTHGQLSSSWLQQQQLSQQQVQQTQQQQWLAAPQQIPVESIVRPTIVEQSQRLERTIEVQPIIHREIDAPEVRVIEQHIYESAPLSHPAIITRQPIIENLVKTRIIEEIQPIIHREVPQPFIERIEQHVNEHIVQEPTFTKEVLGEQQHPFMAPSGLPLQQNLNQSQQPLL